MEPRVDPDAPEEAEDAEARRLFGRVPFDPKDAWGTASKVPTPGRAGLLKDSPWKIAPSPRAARAWLRIARSHLPLELHLSSVSHSSLR